MNILKAWTYKKYCHITFEAKNYVDNVVGLTKQETDFNINYDDTKWKTTDSALGIRTRGRTMEDADETTELWRLLIPDVKSIEQITFGPGVIFLCNLWFDLSLKWANPGLFLFIFVFSTPHNLIIDESIDGVLGTRTQGGRMEDADESMELWRHPDLTNRYLIEWWLPNLTTLPST